MDEELLTRLNKIFPEDDVDEENTQKSNIKIAGGEIATGIIKWYIQARVYNLAIFKRRKNLTQEDWKERFIKLYSDISVGTNINKRDLAQFCIQASKIGAPLELQLNLLCKSEKETRKKICMGLKTKKYKAAAICGSDPIMVIDITNPQHITATLNNLIDYFNSFKLNELITDEVLPLDKFTKTAPQFPQNWENRLLVINTDYSNMLDFLINAELDIKNILTEFEEYYAECANCVHKMLLYCGQLRRI